MAAVLALAMVMATALAVDVGRVAYTSRDQQGVTDRLALDGMTVVNEAMDGPEVEDFDDLHDAVEQELEASLQRNPGTDGRTARGREVTLLELGRVGDDAFEAMCSAVYDRDHDAGCTGDVSDPPDGIPDWTVADVTAVRVATESFVPFVLAIGDEEGGRPVTREAVAQAMSMASIMVGSELVGVEGGLLEDVLNGAICDIALDAGSGSCDLDISAFGYRGLAATDVRLGDLVEELDVVAGSPDQVLAANLTAVELLTAMANVLDGNGQTDQARLLAEYGADGTTVVGGIAAVLPTDQLKVSLLDLLTFGSTTPHQAADARVNVWDLVQGHLQLANGDNFISLPGLGVAIPGLGVLGAGVTIIEAPSTAIGRVGDGATTQAQTGQASVELDATVLTGTGAGEVDVVGSITGALSGLSGLDVVVEPVHLPIVAEAATATASLTGIACNASPEPDTITETSTSVASIALGDRDPATGTIVPADVTRVTLTLTATVPLVVTSVTVPVLEVVVDVDAATELDLDGSSSGPQMFDVNTFTDEDPDVGQLTYPRGELGTGGSFGSIDPAALDLVTDVDVTALYDLSVSAALGLLGISLSDLVDGVVEGLATSIAPLVTESVGTAIEPLLDSLGIGLAKADTWARWAHCEGRSLAYIASPNETP